jgi:nucleoside-diphosphate-sugar epimerase
VQHRQSTTIAILGADTVVGGALCALLGDQGYRINPLDSHPTGIVDELLEGADLLLLAPRLDKGAREAFLGAMGKTVPQTADVPVIELSTALEEALPEKEGVLRMPWPCETRTLVERIEAALAGERPNGALAV